MVRTKFQGRRCNRTRPCHSQITRRKGWIQKLATITSSLPRWKNQKRWKGEASLPTHETTSRLEMGKRYAGDVLMTVAVLLRSGMTLKCHVPFWRAVEEVTPLLTLIYIAILELVRYIKLYFGERGIGNREQGTGNSEVYLINLRNAIRSRSLFKRRLIEWLSRYMI